MGIVTFADVVHQAITFSTEDPADAVILKLLDTPWVQRLRDINQTANARLVYMFSEHSRFGHSLGVSFLAREVLRHLRERFPTKVAQFEVAVGAAALLHDIGHLAPGSHTAFSTWFPNLPDSHEELAIRILREDGPIRSILLDSGTYVPDLVEKVLLEDAALPPWTWEILSGGGWNVDRGNWCIVDSIFAGVSYGKYNIPALTGSLTITEDNRLALEENRLDAMLHFAVSRQAMYRQLYQHRVILSADTLNRAIAQRARDIGPDHLFADATMRSVLAASTPTELTLDTIFRMRESWWRYHLMEWRTGRDTILADLADRLVHRRLFKTVRVIDAPNGAHLRERAATAMKKRGMDPRYYLHEISTAGVQGGDSLHSIDIALERGGRASLEESDPLFRALMHESHGTPRRWLVIPAEVKRVISHPTEL